MNILITGGLGFIGVNLAKYLSGKNYSVKLIDSLISTTEDHYKYALSFKNTEIIIADILDYEKIISLMKGIDVCIHLAFPASKCDRNYNNQFTDIASRGTLNILEACRINKVKIIYASSISVYGYPNKIPINENTVVNPFLIYGVHKLLGELYVKSYSDLYKLNYLILRIGDTFGPFDNRNSAIKKFFDSTKNNENIILNNDGTTIRSYIFINDVTNIIEKLISINIDKTTINIANNDFISIKDLSDYIIKLSNKQLKTIINNNYTDERKYIFDIKYLDTLLGENIISPIKDSVSLYYSNYLKN